MNVKSDHGLARVEDNGAVSSQQVPVNIMKILANEVAKFTCA